MIKSAMRQALKESLMQRKSSHKHDRAKAYTGEDSAGLPSFGSKKLAPKVEDAEEDAMEELSQKSPSEYEGSPEEEMSESDDEAKEEGDHPEFEAEEPWREEQKAFMKNKPTAKKPKKSGSFIASIGKRPVGNAGRVEKKKIDPPFRPQSSKMMG